MLRCPVCKEKLNYKTKSWVCSRGHVYDISRKGTLNLLMSQKKKTHHHGDDKGMVMARTRFLEKGYYMPLCEAILRSIPKHAKTALDLGSGEGWYTDQIQSKTGINVVGVDVSKDAVEAASKRNKSVIWVIGSSYDIPLMDASCDVCWSVFAPFDAKEAARILKPGGIFIHIIPRKDHLLELKSIVYDTVHLNDAVPYIDVLHLDEEECVERFIHLRGNELIKDLFAMTPYIYRTPPQFAKRLDAVNDLRVRIACDVRKYIKM